jgi:acyl-CoA reductase-like NAD-dependent aldehyde dehydrogenase
MSIDTTNRTNSAGTDARRQVVVKCPATSEVVGSVPVATADEVEAIAARLRAAQPWWHQMGVEARARWLGKWRDWMLDHSDELLTLLQLETGKSPLRPKEGRLRRDGGQAAVSERLAA